jgi:group I intron endonuclease
MAQGIYKIINVINNKFYVGSAVDFKRRKTRHFSELRTKKHNNSKLQNAWNKYGEQAFVFVIVEDLPDGVDLLAAENVWLKEHVGKNYCYNIGVDATAPMLGMSGEASPTWGYKHTAKTISIITNASTGRKHTPEDIEKIRQHLIGKPKSAAVCAKISATLSGDGNFWYGKQRPDHGAKVSKAIEVYKDDVLLKVYDSIKALRDELKLKPPTVNRALKSGIKIVRGNFVGYSFKYTCTVTK